MGILVKFGDFLGRVFAMLVDPRDVLHRLPSPEDESFHIANAIDWYDHTVLKSAQMPEFVQELDRVISQTKDEDDVRFLEVLRDLAMQCSREPRFKLEFIGD